MLPCHCTKFIRPLVISRLLHANYNAHLIPHTTAVSIKSEQPSIPAVLAVRAHASEALHLRKSELHAQLVNIVKGR